MRGILIVIGLFTLAVALRSAKANLFRKLGALVVLIATFLMVFFISESLILGTLATLCWFLLPWIELLTRVRDLRMPLKNRLQHETVPNPSFFPHAVEASNGMEKAGFEHLSDCSWDWSGMKQHFKIYWHPEERSTSYVCLCEQKEISFAFLAITSIDMQGQTWRTSNFPFSPTLKSCPSVHWNYIACEKSCFKQLINEHRRFLDRSHVRREALTVPDPDQLEEQLQEEMSQQVIHNLEQGIIEASDQRNFKYSTRGLFFLWGQLLKDMIRLC